VRARAAGFRIRQVPVPLHPRRAGRRAGAILRELARALLELAKLYRELCAARDDAERRALPARGSAR
jgi:predicted amidophosphoribosyltransferase